MDNILDDKDLKIIEILKENADLTTRQISKKTLIPQTTIHNRIKRLKELGIIRRFTLELDNAKIGKPFVAYVLFNVNLRVLKEKSRTQYDLANELRRFDFVERVDIVSGGTDLVAIVRVKDVAEFDKVLLGKLQVLEGVDNTQSLIVLHEG
ncbi:Lrp/AsnC family transcriptional regulator [Candidatus Woesearchaeota archaeon]|nr:Lrp/AsnC family transcriptional regulator [Candidatus Woesearchaeota archaeon]